MMYTNNNLLKFEILFNIRKVELIENDWNNSAELRLLFMLYTNFSLSISNKCLVTSLFSDSFEFYYYNNDSSIPLQCYRSNIQNFCIMHTKEIKKFCGKYSNILLSHWSKIMVIDKECKEDCSWWYELQWTVT